MLRWSSDIRIRPDNPAWMIGTLTLIGVAMVGSLFSMDAWNNITFTAAEVKKSVA